MEEILKNPDKLKDLDLDAFAEELERQDYGNKRTTLYDIRNELFEPFKERRSTYASMSQVCANLASSCVTCTLAQILFSQLSWVCHAKWLNTFHHALLGLNEPASWET